MCQVLEVSVSGSYAWRGRPESERARQDRVLTEKIKASHQRSRETYGTPRIQADLAEEGERVSRQRIGRRMKAANLEVRCKRKFRVTTKASPAHPAAANLLNREFEVDRPNRKWVTDITDLPTTEGWLYLATVMDLFSRKIVGWALNDRLHTPLVMDALNMAWQRRQPEAGLLHHSDRGSQYTSEVYRQALERLKAVQSMSNKGECWADGLIKEMRMPPPRGILMVYDNKKPDWRRRHYFIRQVVPLAEKSTVARPTSPHHDHLDAGWSDSLQIH